MAEFRTRTIETFPEYAAFLNEMCRSENWLFRGQYQDWTLLPKLARLELKQPVLEAEQRMFEQFKLESPSYLPASVHSEWDLLIVAQHHGLPTRLLDWSQNPLAALWFAIENPSTDGSPAVIWALEYDDALVIRPDETDSPFTVERSRVLRPSHVARRQIAQLGWFTVHAHCPDRHRFVAMEESRLADQLTKIVVPARAFAGLRYHLDRCGINRAGLFPDLDGLCRHISWRHTRLVDEAGPSNPPQSDSNQRA